MQIIENTNCSICNASSWKSLDYLRDQKYWYDKDYLYEELVGFKICQECGFVTYDYTDDKELKRRYENERKIVDLNSVLTTNRKLEYHKRFLEGINFDKATAILDYGCGIGYFLNWFKYQVNIDCQCYGVEFNDIFIRYAREEYNLSVYDYIPKEEYDLICSYHTFEHLQYPDKILEQFKGCLKDDGSLYISIPCNIRQDILDEASGALTIEFEELYHLNHVNQFSKQSLKNILWQGGFEITKEDDSLYGYTVLCRKAEKEEIVKENYLEIVALIEKQKKAMDFYKEEKWEEARKIHPGYVDAWLVNVVKNFKDLAEQERILKEALKATENAYKLKRQLAFLYFQWDQNKAKEHNITNHIRESKRLWEELIEEKPGMEDFLYYLAMIEIKYFKNFKKARELLNRILEINPAKWGEVQNLIGLCWKEKNV